MLAAAEALAASAHEAWVRDRVAAGWTTGDRVDARALSHPALRPFEDLPEPERARLLQVAIAAIGSLTASGYRLGQTSIGLATAAGPDTSESALARELAEAAAAAANLQSLLAVWRSQGADTWARLPDASCQAAERFVQLGEPLAAYDAAANALKQHPAHVRLRQILGLALARSGASEQANTVLRQLHQDGHQDEETVGLLARTHKDLAVSSGDDAERSAHLREAYRYYLQAYQTTAGYWTGINAATLATVLGARNEAVALAATVRDQARAAMERAEANGKDAYWPLATMGEAALILGNVGEAEALYRRAGEIGRRRYADLHASRRNARLLLRHLDLDAALVERCFHVPSVVVFAGQAIDAPGAPRARFPEHMEGAVRSAIRDRLIALDAGFGYASAACGSDILFLEGLLDLGGEAHVVLPYDASAFLWDHVENVPGGDWGVRFARVLEHAAEVVVSSSKKLEGADVSFEYADRFLYGLGRIRSSQLGARLHPLAVWDGEAGDALGCTVERWRTLGHEVEVIDLRALRLPTEVRVEADDTPPGDPAHPGASDAAAVHATSVAESLAFAPEIRALLFADAVGFSKLDEDQVPRFVRHFLGLVGDVVTTASQPAMLRNTWGDGIYCVFPDVASAALCALDLNDRIADTDWTAKGLPPLTLRIGLHAGPVYACVDPVTGRQNYVGAQVSRAARIEPITPPGQVYASQAFAALAAASHSPGFRCDYVGQTGLAKNYGTYPTFVVRRGSVAELR